MMQFRMEGRGAKLISGEMTCNVQLLFVVGGGWRSFVMLKCSRIRQTESAIQPDPTSNPERLGNITK